MLLSATGTTEEDGARVLLLGDLRDLFAERARMASADIVAALIAMEDRPWPEWRRGRPLSTRSLARLLSAFSIRPKTIRDGGAAYRLICDDGELHARFNAAEGAIEAAQRDGDAAQMRVTVAVYRGVIHEALARVRARDERDGE